MSAIPTTDDITRLARRIHRCPEHYEGPCWGPTPEDREIAQFRLTEVMNCPTPENHADGPFRYCPNCKWDETWGEFKPAAPDPKDPE